MVSNSIKTQGGYMLLLTILLFMGISGAVVVSFTQKAKHDAEASRYKHNQRVLQQAKDALLMYAYNYPQNFSRGPGRLPCPDTDHDIDVLPDTSFNCENVTGMVGRFPYGDPLLNIQPTLDASGQDLWYSVASTFANTGPVPVVVNSNSVGSITLVDQAGEILYDGGALSGGIAAILIAPGPILERDNNGDGTYEYIQLRNTALQEADSRNYLDTFGDFDNSVFVNSSNADADGFIIGPVYDNAVDRVVVNDQIMIITADEVIAMAEKATLAAYRDALQGYSDKIVTDLGLPPLPGVWTQYYPWLYDYSGLDLADFPSDPNSNFVNELAFLGDKGRVPSIFGDYFTDSDSQTIESELNFDFSLSYPISPTTVGFDQVLPFVATGTWQFNNAAQHIFNAITTLPQTIQFLDYDAPGGPNGRLSATAITFQVPYQVEAWFWDEADLGPATGVWTICPDNGNGIAELSDCNRDLVGNPTPGSANNLAGVEALRVIAEVDFPVGVPVEFDFAYNLNDPVITATTSADGASHATIQGVYLGADRVNLPVTLSYELDRHYLALFNNLETGTVLASDLNLGNVTLGLRYYPELPDWVFANDWHSSVQMAYAQPYRPDQIGVAADCIIATDCLVFDGAINATDNKKALLVIGGEHDMADGDAAPQPPLGATLTLADELDDIFNPENSDADIFYDGRTVQDPLALGDTEIDKILVIDEL